MHYNTRFNNAHNEKCSSCLECGCCNAGLEILFSELFVWTGRMNLFSTIEVSMFKIHVCILMNNDYAHFFVHLQGHHGEVWCMTISPDGSYMVSNHLQISSKYTWYSFSIICFKNNVWYGIQ